MGEGVRGKSAVRVGNGGGVRGGVCGVGGKRKECKGGAVQAE